MNARVNVPHILGAMSAKGWGRVDTCVNCGINNKTLAKILEGQVPKRIDALFRLVNGLNITMEDALIGSPQHRDKPALRLVDQTIRRDHVKF